MVNKFGKSLRRIRSEDQEDSIIMLGDFNMAGIRWVHSEQDLGYLAPSERGSKAYEFEFAPLCSVNLLRFSTEPIHEFGGQILMPQICIKHFKCYNPLPKDRLDKKLTHHNAIGIEVTNLRRNHHTTQSLSCIICIQCYVTQKLIWKIRFSTELRALS